MTCELFQRGDFRICPHCQQPLAPGQVRECSRGDYPGRAAVALRPSSLILHPSSPASPPPAALADCLHRGPELRREECPTCSGQVQLKIFACAVHRECTLGELPGVRRCDANCGDYRPIVSPESATGSPSDCG